MYFNVVSGMSRDATSLNDQYSDNPFLNNLQQIKT